MFDTFRKLLELLDRRERFQLALLFMAVLIMAFLETVSVAAIFPFLSVASDPAQIHDNAWLAWAYQSLGFTSTTSFLVALGVAAAAALMLSNAWIAGTHWAEHRFVRGRCHSQALRLLDHYLAQPYVYFLHRNSADLTKNILSEVDWVGMTMQPALRLTSKALVALALVVLLVFVDVQLALVVAVVLGTAYGGVYLAVRRALTRIGSERVAANAARYTVASEVFDAIKDVKLLGKEQVFRSRFTPNSRRFNRHQATAAIIGEMPRYALETVAFGGVLIITVYLLLARDNLQQVLPVLGLYAFAGYRLMPSLQQIFNGLAKVRFAAPAVYTVHKELAEGIVTRHAPAPAPTRSGPVPGPLVPKQRLQLEGVTFTYPGAHRPAIEDLSLTINANTTVGVIGATGAGKTTFVDIILGLLRPQQGEIRIDDTPLTEARLRAWQDGLGYVAQHIYLADDTIARNIAFGIPPDQIDREAVERAARLAHIHDFVAGELPEGYATIVGERGVRLSGGQRQRIGIARALYHDPAVLVLDEATSALDDSTEAAVMEAIHALAGMRTIIVIAHRTSTLRACDVIYRFAHGRVVEAGTYAELVGQRMREHTGRQAPLPKGRLEEEAEHIQVG